MKKMLFKMVSMVLILILVLSANIMLAYAASLTVTYRAHCQNYGWVTSLTVRWQAPREKD